MSLENYSIKELREEITRRYSEEEALSYTLTLEPIKIEIDYLLKDAVKIIKKKRGKTLSKAGLEEIKKSLKQDLEGLAWASIHLNVSLETGEIVHFDFETPE